VKVEMSGREAEVLGALAGGLTNAQIGNRLHLSVRTVEGYVSSLLRKYGVPDRRALAVIAESAEVAVPADQLAGLPGWRTSFVGRAAERAEVQAALDEHRLVTVAGPGGVGKTRLAVLAAGTVAGEFPAGGAFVDLAPARADSVSQAVAAALGVTESPHQPLDSAIQARLRRGRTLVVLDNCEHVIDAVAALVERVLAACPATTVLATSRERLAISGEHVTTLEPLPLGVEAEELFTQRAGAAPEDLAAVGAVCARLDGLPLAIELAAARCAALGTTGLLAGLGDHLRLLAGGRGAADRHRSLRAVIGWSHDLLDPEEQALFRALAVFAGEFDLAAAATVSGTVPAAAADVLGRLVDKSLVVRAPGGISRWRLLQTIRAFAVEQLDGGDDRAVVRQRYLAWASAAATALNRRLGGRWTDEFDAVAAELRAALAMAPPGPHAQAHRLARSLARLTFARGFVAEALTHYRDAATRATTHAGAVEDLRAAAECAHVLTDSDLAVELLHAAADRAAEAGDGNARAIALARAVELTGRFMPVTFRTEIPPERQARLLAEARAAGDPADPLVKAHLALAAAWVTVPAIPGPDPDKAEAAAEAARATGNPALIVASFDALQAAAFAGGRTAETLRRDHERLHLAARLDVTDPHHATEIADATSSVSLAAVAEGELPKARAVATFIRDHELHESHPFLTLSKTIPAFVLCGDLGEAVRLADDMWDAWLTAGSPPTHWLRVSLPFVELAHALRGDHRQAGLWRARVGELTDRPGPTQERRARPLPIFAAARTAVHSGDLAAAAHLAARTRVLPVSRFIAYTRSAVAELAVVAGLPDARQLVDQATSECGHHPWAAACLARATGRLDADPEVLAESVRRWDELGARVERAATLLLLPDRADEGRAELAGLGAAAPYVPHA
jgi:predicted ATPase/DNA-binding CsgD family transcriptional regulator